MEETKHSKGAEEPASAVAARSRADSSSPVANGDGDFFQPGRRQMVNGRTGEASDRRHKAEKS
jgi:hypothetical protein